MRTARWFRLLGLKLALGLQLVVFAVLGFIGIPAVIEYHEQQAEAVAVAQWIIKMTPEQLANTPI